MNFNNIALPLTLMNTSTTLTNILSCNAILNDDYYHKHNSINNHKNDDLTYIPDKTEIKTEEVLPNIRPVQKDLLEENWFIEFCRRAKL